MTWSKAMPVLIVCVIFDALRIFFEQFWFFGPALAMMACTGIGGAILEYVPFGLGMKAAAAACGAALVVAEYLGIGVPIAAFGVLMAMAVGLMGWLTVGLMLILSNARIFEENAGHALWFAASLLVSEIPIVGTIPAFTVVVWRMYRVQIKKETAALRKYESEQAAALQEEQQQRAAEFMQFQASRQAQITEQEEMLEQEQEEQLMGEIPEKALGAT
jgi:hypothetical protein